jgi:two-component system chemotaxis response regulator CheB
LANRDIIVIGASAGGIEALRNLIKALPASLPATLFVVMHIGGNSLLSEILDRCSKLPVSEAKDGSAFKKSHIYVAPSDRHLLLKDGKMVLSRGPRENRNRPAIDPLFRAAARNFRERVIGIILTGALDDGSAGLFAVKNRGGIAIVQDPSDAVEPGMPRNALRTVQADHCVPLKKIAPLLARITKEKLPRKPKTKIATTAERRFAMTPQKRPGFRDDALSFVCPECQGPLYECREGELVKYNCQIGHNFSPESLSESHTDALERALWIAMRTLNERIAIHEALAEQHKHQKNSDLAKRLIETALGAAHHVKMIREILDRL